ncbi:hypothetical protein [Ruminococcoides intestinale]|uniref:hypothetical protein n=1 Tax=Ruminococcoides intestinale TaxID=3133162 RepID=UPI0032D50150
MDIDIKTYSYSKIKTFVNLRYLSMRIPDLIFKKLPKIEEIVHNGRSFPAGMIAGALTIAIKPVISLLGQNGGLSTATFNDFIAFFEYLIAVCLIVNMVDAFVKAYYAKIYNIN